MRHIWTNRLMLSANAWALVGAGLVVVFGLLPPTTPTWARLLGMLGGFAGIVYGARQLWLAHLERLGLSSIGDRLSQFADDIYAFFPIFMKLCFGPEPGADEAWRKVDVIWKDAAAYVDANISAAERLRLESVLQTEGYVDHEKDNRGMYYVHVVLLARHIESLRARIASGAAAVKGRRVID